MFVLAYFFFNFHMWQKSNNCCHLQKYFRPMKVNISIQWWILILGFPRSVPNQWPFVLGTTFIFCLISACTDIEKTNQLVHNETSVLFCLLVCMKLYGTYMLRSGTNGKNRIILSQIQIGSLIKLAALEECGGCSKSICKVLLENPIMASYLLNESGTIGRRTFGRWLFEG